MRVLNRLYGFCWIVPGNAARASQAHIGFLGPFLKANGIAALINLRGRNPDYGWWRSETRICARLGIAHYDAMLDSRRLPTREMLVTLFDALAAAPTPFLLKCSGGQDRTGFAAALYLVESGGWGARERAAKEFSAAPKKQQRWLGAFLDYAEAEARGAVLSGWARAHYDPAAFADWLGRNDLGAGFAGIFDAPRASPFQWRL